MCFRVCHEAEAEALPIALNIGRLHVRASQIITGSHDKTIKMWDLRKGKTMSTLTYHKKSIRAMAAHPQEYAFAAGSADNIKKYRLPQARRLRCSGSGATPRPLLAAALCPLPPPSSSARHARAPAAPRAARDRFLTTPLLSCIVLSASLPLCGDPGARPRPRWAAVYCRDEAQLCTAPFKFSPCAAAQA